MMALIVTIGLVAAPSAAALPGEKTEITTLPTAAQEAQIAKGDIIVHHVNRHPIYHLDVYGMIEAPFDAVWSAITEYDEYREYLPLVVESGVKKRAGDTVWQYVKMQPPWPLHAHWMVNVNVENRRRGTITWTMADGNLRFERGYWLITPVGSNRTKLQYHLTVDPWLDIVPPWLVEFATRQVMPDVVKGIRKRVKANLKG